MSIRFGVRTSKRTAVTGGAVFGTALLGGGLISALFRLCIAVVVLSVVLAWQVAVALAVVLAAAWRRYAQ